MPRNDPKSARGPDRLLVMEDKLRRIRALIRSYVIGDEPEGAPSARRTVMAIADVVEESVPAARCVTCLIHGYWDKCPDPRHIGRGVSP